MISNSAGAGRAAASQPLKGREWWNKDFDGLLQGAQDQVVLSSAGPAAVAPAAGAAAAPVVTGPVAPAAPTVVASAAPVVPGPVAPAAPTVAPAAPAAVAPGAAAPAGASGPSALQAPWWKQDFEGIFGDASGSPPPPPPLSPRVRQALKAYADAAATAEPGKGRLDTRA